MPSLSPNSPRTRGKPPSRDYTRKCAAVTTVRPKQGPSSTERRSSASAHSASLTPAAAALPRPSASSRGGSHGRVLCPHCSQASAANFQFLHCGMSSVDSSDRAKKRECARKMYRQAVLRLKRCKSTAAASACRHRGRRQRVTARGDVAAAAQRNITAPTSHRRTDETHSHSGSATSADAPACSDASGRILLIIFKASLFFGRRPGDITSERAPRMALIGQLLLRYCSL